MGNEMVPKWHKSAPFSRTVAFFFFLAVASACGEQAAVRARAQFSFLGGPEWRGQAEIAEYEGQVMRYRESRPARLTLITVTEPFDPKTLVKPEQPLPRAVTVLKQNQVLSYQTGVYPYHQMNSLFWRARDGEVLKATMTSQEWCGQTLKDLRREGHHLRLTWNSYWEGEATGSAVIEVPRHTRPAMAVLYDELPLLVRTPEFRNFRKLHLFPLLMSSQVYRPDWDIGGPARTPRFLDAVLEPDTEKLRLGGREVVALRLSVRWSQNGRELQETFWVDEADPNRTLLRWRRYDGGEFTLTKKTFAAYWKMNRVGDRLP